jgi:hypothetical protein
MQSPKCSAHHTNAHPPTESTAEARAPARTKYSVAAGPAPCDLGVELLTVLHRQYDASPRTAHGVLAPAGFALHHDTRLTLWVAPCRCDGASRHETAGDPPGRPSAVLATVQQEVSIHPNMHGE